MGRGKHSDYGEVEFNFKPIRNSMIIGIILIIMIGIIFGVFHMITKLQKVKNIEVSSEEDYIQSTYDILGQIIIDKINVNQNILDSSEEEALQEGVIKLYGNNLNEIGNFCIAGHNKNGIFQGLSELEINDEIKIQNKDKQLTTYKITEIYSVEPVDLDALRQTNEKTEITLITCENYSTKRLIVKAQAEI